MEQLMYALLVGINHYASPTVPDLGGCLNDVAAMADLLQSRFGVPSANIVTLLNGQATYNAVKSQFRQHLIESARAFVEQAGARGQRMAPPAFLFHFSGHGSQAPDPTGQEPDGFDETLVCHDSRLPDIYDLKDWELGKLLDELAQFTDNITVILDCCHSGSGTRSEAKVVANTRACFPDLRPQPTPRPLLRPNADPTNADPTVADPTVADPTVADPTVADPTVADPTVAEPTIADPTVADPAVAQPPKVMRSGTPVRPSDRTHHWARGRSNHVLLAACRDQEKALEYIPGSGSSTDRSTAARRHGVLTHYLIPLLETLDAQQLPTYREIYEQLRLEVTRAYPQTPQCEGDWGRVLFGGIRPDRDLWLTVVEQRDGLYWINGGLAHGLAEGARFRAYRPAARTLDDAGEVLGTLEVVDVGAVRSGCAVVNQLAAIPVHARLQQVNAAGSTQRKSVAVEISRGLIAGAVRERLAQDDLAGLVALVPAGSEAMLRLALVSDALEIQDGNGHRVGKAYPLRELNRMRRPLRAGDLDPIAQDLQRIVRAQRLDLLQNADSDLADALALTVKRLTYNALTGTPETGALIAGTTAPNAASGQSAPLRHGEPFVVEIINRGDEALYVGVLLRSGAWTVEQLYPEVRGAQEQLPPERTLTIGLSTNPERQLRLLLDGTVAAEEVTFLLIGTAAEADFEALLQYEASIAATQEARRQGEPASGQRVMRSFKLGGAGTAADEWMSVQLKVRVMAG